MLSLGLRFPPLQFVPLSNPNIESKRHQANQNSSGINKNILKLEHQAIQSLCIHVYERVHPVQGWDDTAYRLKQTYKEAPLVALFGSVW